MTFTPGRPVIQKARDRRLRAAGEAERPLPPLRTQAANAVRAARRVLAARVRGQNIWLTPAATEAHRAVCQTCEWFRPSDQRCAHPQCGCFTQLKLKLATEQCPAARW